jgi:hypothetical protein
VARFLNLKMLHPLLLVLSVLAAQSARAQGIDLEAAKREGELVFYSATRAEDTDQLVRAFTKKYPFIKGSYYRAGGDPLLQRILTESRGGKHLFDVVSTLGTQIVMLKEKNLLAPYRSRHQASYAKGFYDPEGYWTDTYDLYVTIAYNTRMVPKNAVPKRWEDLLDPRWRDEKICLDLRRHDWFYGMMEVMGPDRGKKFMEGLRNQKPAFRQGNTLILQLMTAGDDRDLAAHRAIPARSAPEHRKALYRLCPFAGRGKDASRPAAHSGPPGRGAFDRKAESKNPEALSGKYFNRKARPSWI